MSKPNTCCAPAAQPSTPLPSMSHDNHRRTVRDAYAQVAQASDEGQSCGSASSCCGVDDDVAINTLISTRLGYSQADLDLAPVGADMGLGCGNPKAIAALKPGEIVVDLGSGGGFDCFLAVREVGCGGQVIGVDMTPEMVSKARANAQKGQYENVEFRLGEIEHLPIADAVADVVISNCVIDLEAMMHAAGFEQIHIQPKDESKIFIEDWAPGRKVTDFVVSATIEATKPGTTHF